MNRTTAGDLGISFVRGEDGLLLLLDSPKWKLERGKAYTVRLTAGGQSVEAQALAETKGVTIAVADHLRGGVAGAVELARRHWLHPVRPGNSQPCGRAAFHQARSSASRCGESIT